MQSRQPKLIEEDGEFKQPKCRICQKKIEDGERYTVIEVSMKKQWPNITIHGPAHYFCAYREQYNPNGNNRDCGIMKKSTYYRK